MDSYKELRNEVQKEVLRLCDILISLEKLERDVDSELSPTDSTIEKWATLALSNKRIKKTITNLNAIPLEEISCE